MKYINIILGVVIAALVIFLGLHTALGKINDDTVTEESASFVETIDAEGAAAAVSYIDIPGWKGRKSGTGKDLTTGKMPDAAMEETPAAEQEKCPATDNAAAASAAPAAPAAKPAAVSAPVTKPAAKPQAASPTPTPSTTPTEGAEAAATTEKDGKSTDGTDTTASDGDTKLRGDESAAAAAAVRGENGDNVVTNIDGVEIYDSDFVDGTTNTNKPKNHGEKSDGASSTGTSSDSSANTDASSAGSSQDGAKNTTSSEDPGADNTSKDAGTVPSSEKPSDASGAKGTNKANGNAANGNGNSDGKDTPSDAGSQMATQTDASTAGSSVVTTIDGVEVYDSDFVN